MDHRNAYAVQSTRHLIAVVIKFTPGVQGGHDHFRRRHLLLWVKVGRNTSTVVFNRNSFLGMDGDLHFIAVSGEGLIDRVVDQLLHHVVQSRAILGITDVHSRPLPNSIKAF